MVPRRNQLQPGVGVNIVLKDDQRCGKLTTGAIANVLTKGDHPRGIKVRLIDGQVGRVQSMTSLFPIPNPGDTSGNQFDAPIRAAKRRDEQGNTRGMQQDVRSDGHDPAGMPPSRSLADYVKFPKEAKAAPAIQADAKTEVGLQQQLEKEFPDLDTALIAAIVADYVDVEATRGVLKTLC